MKRGARRFGRLAVLAIALMGAGSGLLRGADLASQLPDKPARFVTDRAGVLASGAAEQLNDRLAQFERDTSNQILVWIERKIPEGFTLEDFTVRVAQKWRAGQEKTDNGAILFVFTEDRKVRIEVGYGLEGAIPDITAKRIIENEIVPHFRAGNYGAGVEAGAAALMSAARGEYKGTGKTRGEQGRRRTDLFGCLPWAIIFGIFFLPWFLRLRRGFRTHGGSGWWSGGGPPIIFGGGGGGFLGGGGGGGGSFGGFSGGGGSFGGGGASGSW